MQRIAGIALLCVVFFHKVLSDTPHSHWRYEYLYSSLFFLGTALTAQGAKERVFFFGFLAVSVLFLAGGFFHFPRLFYILPGVVALGMAGYGLKERWRMRASATSLKSI